MTGKGQAKKPKAVGLDPINVVSNETNVPSPYFAGFRQMPVSWIMNPVIAFTKPSSGTGKGK